MQPEDFNIKIPQWLDEEMFREGFAHGMVSNTLTIFKKSYGEGFRTAKILCKDLREQQGVHTLPLKQRIKFTAKPSIDKD